ncbi:MAG: bile acid:sodium symporter, partial [Solirubrobacteraceae bacterium]|nr:bile acid:sodium symporter [Solirubrobacteraceae bacterium]
RGVAVGMINLAIVAPLLALGIAELFDLEPVLAVGLVLLGAAPGGTMANLLTHLAKGDTALSITMTAISSLAAVITVPLYVGLASEHFDATGLTDEISMPVIVARVFVTTVVPLMIGLYAGSRHPEWVAEHAGTIKRTAIVVFALIIVAAIAAHASIVFDHLGVVFAAALALNVAAMTISFLVARAVRLDGRQATAIAIELGVHNAALAVAIGATIDEELAVPAAVYSSFMLGTAGLFAKAMHRRNSAVVELR